MVQLELSWLGLEGVKMRSPSSRYDVVIVGASLAGSAAAVTLARHGVATLLLEKANMPREKPCGEGLSS
ncbi:MAG: hypothetical protein RL417_577, partial [Pseudomonadota bacterium]